MEWFTPARRQTIYTLLTILAPALVVLGLATDEQVTQWLTVAGLVLLGSGTALARRHVDTDDRG